MLFRTVCLAATLALAVSAAEDAATERERALLDRIEQLEKRVGELEARAAVTAAQPVAVQTTQTAPPPAEVPAGAATAQIAQAASAPPAAAPAHAVADFLRGTTVNFQVDGYYSYNFNAPIGRANLLRAYDVLSNAFSLNQANVIIENAPDPANGKPFGARLDLQWGQATETLQANTANELRPEIYRAVFQAYGTYIIPLGSGVTVDFGKWASSLGIEGNYTKDQINYSRSFWFNYLPFYHMGASRSRRASPCRS